MSEEQVGVEEELLMEWEEAFSRYLDFIMGPPMMPPPTHFDSLLDMLYNDFGYAHSAGMPFLTPTLRSPSHYGYGPPARSTGCDRTN